MKLEWIQTLEQVHRSGSFSAVAHERGVSAMAISKQISALEATVGVALVNRSRRKISLTETGLALVKRGERLLAEHRALQGWLQERLHAPSGKLTIMCLESDAVALTLTPWLGEFQAQYPEIQLEIVIQPKFEEIDVDKADILWGFSQYIGDLIPGLRRKPLLTSRFGIYASPDYLYRFGEPVHPSDLKKQGHLIIGNTNNQPSNALIVRGGDDFQDENFAGVYLHSKVTTSAGAMEMAEQGLGLVNASDLLFQRRYRSDPYRLKPVLEPYWVSGVAIYAFYHQVKIEQLKVRVFLDFFSEKVSAWVASL